MKTSRTTATGDEDNEDAMDDDVDDDGDGAKDDYVDDDDGDRTADGDRTTDDDVNDDGYGTTTSTTIATVQRTVAIAWTRAAAARRKVTRGGGTQLQAT